MHSPQPPPPQWRSVAKPLPPATLYASPMNHSNAYSSPAYGGVSPAYGGGNAYSSPLPHRASSPMQQRSSPAKPSQRASMARRSRGAARALYVADVDENVTGGMHDGVLQLRLPSGEWNVARVELWTSGRVYLFQCAADGVKSEDDPWCAIDLHEYDLGTDASDGRVFSLGSTGFDTHTQYILSSKDEAECSTWCELITRLHTHIAEVASGVHDVSTSRDAAYAALDGTHPMLKVRKVIV